MKSFYLNIIKLFVSCIFYAIGINLMDTGFWKAILIGAILIIGFHIQNIEVGKE